LEEGNYAHVSTYVFKAEAALDAAGSSGDKKKAGPDPVKDKIQAKLDLAMAVSLLGQANYDNASWAFMKVGKNLDGWERKVILSSDILVAQLLIRILFRSLLLLISPSMGRCALWRHSNAVH
jgi:COP9 signalosome complex subunit 1